MRAKVLENTDYERDLTSGALINVNKAAHYASLQKRLQQKAMLAEKIKMQRDIEELKETCKSLQNQLDGFKKTL
jgi:hypothetical protein